LSFNIAVAGKGGCGKTTITSLVIRYLLNNGKGPILAVDADSNANLADSLGLEVKETVGTVLDSFQGDKISIPAGMNKQAFLQFKLNGMIIESKGLDLVTMGRGEGPECYCYPNMVLKNFVDELSDSYRYTIMDNEAGMEHLSRRTTRDVDVLLLVSNHTVKGVRTIASISKLASDLRLVVKNQVAVINLVPAELDPLVNAELERVGIVPSAIIPEDKTVYEYDLGLKPLLDLSDDSIAVQAVNGLMDKILDQAVVNS